MTTESPANAAPARSAPYYRGVALVLAAGVFLSLGGIGVRLIEAANEWQILFYRSLALLITLLAVLAVRNRGALPGAFRTAGGKQPYRITLVEGGPFALAGLWERWAGPQGGEAIESCTIVTTEANARLQEIHPRGSRRSTRACR